MISPQKSPALYIAMRRVTIGWRALALVPEPDGGFQGSRIGSPDLPYRHTFMGYVSQEMSFQDAFLTATWDQIFAQGGTPE